MSGPPRPGYHFTVGSGWLNDPHGVSWHEDARGGRYELFFQYNPDAPEWAVACRWGRASSPDLVHWGPADVVLAPATGEAGCWTGSVVVDDDGTPVIAYTSVRADAPDLGAVVLARGDRDWRAWTARPDTPAVDGPPAGLGVVVFRDPHVARDGAGWRMVIGGGTVDGRGLALLYRSPDLLAWSYAGVLAERPATATPVSSGSVWECVQFFPLEHRWVLLLSAWDAGVPLRVVAAVGDFDGHRFLPRRWQRFGATDVPYATTTFLDAAGRRCAMSWAREPGPPAGGYAGALTLPWVLGLRGNLLVQAPHPDVEALRTGRLARLDGAGEAGPFAPFLDVLIDPAGPATVTLRAEDGTTLTVDADGAGTARLSVPGRQPVVLGADAAAPDGPQGGTAVRLLVDAGLVEVGAAAGDAAVLRLPWRGLVTVAAEGAGARVTVHGMPGPG